MGMRTREGWGESAKGVRILGLDNTVYIFHLFLFLAVGVLSLYTPCGLICLGALSIIYWTHILAGSGARVRLQFVFNVKDIATHLVAGIALATLFPLLALEAIRRWTLMFLIEAPRLIFEYYGFRRIDGT